MTLRGLQEDMSAWLRSETEQGAEGFAGSARPGLAVYLNNYRAQLMGCLATSFPVLRAWLGDTAFDSAAATHIDCVPPRAWTLDAYALDFPDTLARLYPADVEVAELGRLERDLDVVFAGADCAPMDSSALADVAWERAILRFVPTLRIHFVTTNAPEIWSAIHAGGFPPALERRRAPLPVVIWRDGFLPRIRPLEAEESAAITQLRAGRTFAQVCAELVERFGEEQGPAMAGAWLGQWLSGHMLAGITVRSG